MVNKIGMLWVTSEMGPAQEHFISHLVRQKLFAAIDSLNPAQESAKSWMLFLPENELHELGLLVSNYILRSKGYNVFYLGMDVPMPSLIESINSVNPNFLLMFNVNPNQTKKLQNCLDDISKEFDLEQFYVCCSMDDKQKVVANDGQQLITSYEDFLEVINRVPI